MRRETPLFGVMMKDENGKFIPGDGTLFKTKKEAVEELKLREISVNTPEESILGLCRIFLIPKKKNTKSKEKA